MRQCIVVIACTAVVLVLLVVLVPKTTRPDAMAVAKALLVVRDSPRSGGGTILNRPLTPEHLAGYVLSIYSSIGNPDRPYYEKITRWKWFKYYDGYYLVPNPNVKDSFELWHGQTLIFSGRLICSGGSCLVKIP
jgi:hypothetical protein